MSVRKLGIALLIGVFSLGYASATCSNATLVGNYGFTVTGVNGSGQLMASVGQFTADGKGGFTGVEAESDGGVITTNIALTGTYSLKSTCSGTGTITGNGATSPISLVVVSNGAQIEFTKTEAGTAQYGYALAQGKAICTDAGFKNVFGFRGGGYSTGSSTLVPNAWTGQVKLDGLGNVAGSETASFGGTIQSFALTGTYTVNSNCTGTAVFNGGGAQANTFFVIVNGGLSAMQIQTDANTINTNFIQR